MQKVWRIAKRIANFLRLYNFYTGCKAIKTNTFAQNFIFLWDFLFLCSALLWLFKLAISNPTQPQQPVQIYNHLKHTTSAFSTEPPPEDECNDSAVMHMLKRWLHFSRPSGNLILKVAHMQNLNPGFLSVIKDSLQN